MKTLAKREGRKELPSPEDISKLILKGDGGNLKELISSIPILLRHALSLEPRRAHSPRLSNFYEYDGQNGNNHLEVCYYGHGGRIYASIDDLKGGSAGDSGVEEVSEAEFLRWVPEDPRRIRDVYTRLRDYIRQEDQKPVRVPHEAFEDLL